MRYSPSSFVELLERPSGGSRSGGSSLKDIFQIMIVILVQSANGRSFLRAFQLTANEAIFPTVVGSQCQSAVGPQLPLGTEAMGVCIRAINKTARIGPIEGICRSNLMVGCFRDSANSSRRTS